GTPTESHPGEMANLLALTGQLEAHFGSYGRYIARYTTVNRFGKEMPLQRKLPELAAKLGNLWVKKTKAELLPHLTGKTHNWRLFDVSTSEYRKAHVEVIDTIIQKAGGAENIAQFDASDIAEWADAFGMVIMSP